MHLQRTRFKKEIVSEFLPPARKSSKVIILCGGMPAYPGRREEVVKFLSSKGYWVFVPRYRGSWESDGSFLKISPEKDVIDVMNGITQGFADLYTDRKYKIKNPEIYLIGGSFGGPAAILASMDRRVRKAFSLSPVIDWRADSKVEPMDFLMRFTRAGFGNGYRFREKDWNKLLKGNFYNPVKQLRELDGKKIFIIYAKDDVYVPYKPTKSFCEKLGCKSILLKRGGHLSTSLIPKFWPKISKFFRS